MSEQIPQPFRLADLHSEGCSHNPDPENFSIGFVGKVSEETRRRVYELREAQSRRHVPACVIALKHLHDHLVGLSDDIRAEVEGTA
jgi:hypothetical protein